MDIKSLAELMHLRDSSYDCFSIDGFEAQVLYTTAEQAQAAVKGMTEKGSINGQPIRVYALTDNY